MPDTEYNPYATPDSALVTGTDFAGYAGFWKRFFAFLIDWLLLSLAFSVFGLLTGGELFTVVDEARWDSVSAVVGIAIPWLYYAGFESSEQQATFGKLALNIQVTDLEGRRDDPLQDDHRLPRRAAHRRGVVSRCRVERRGRRRRLYLAFGLHGDRPGPAAHDRDGRNPQDLEGTGLRSGATGENFGRIRDPRTDIRSGLATFL